VASGKIVQGLPVRGGSNAPSGLFWSLDSLVRVSFIGGTGTPPQYWRYDIISSQSSILSSQSAIEYDGVYYWCGIDRFLMYNGVVREVPNELNINYFFDGLNEEQSNKVFAYKVPRYGEIWWCYPRGSATECTHAVTMRTQMVSEPVTAALVPVFPDTVRHGIGPNNEGTTRDIPLIIYSVTECRAMEALPVLTLAANLMAGSVNREDWFSPWALLNDPENTETEGAYIYLGISQTAVDRRTRTVMLVHEFGKLQSREFQQFFQWYKYKRTGHLDGSETWDFTDEKESAKILKIAGVDKWWDDTTDIPGFATLGLTAPIF
jgi:hypothetical protein